MRYFVTGIGLALFIWDMTILGLFLVTINLIIKHFSKDYIINRLVIWGLIAIFALMYIINNVWQDIMNFGNIWNAQDAYFNQPKSYEYLPFDSDFYL